VKPNQTLCFDGVHHLLDGLFDGDLHAKRLLFLANTTLGSSRPTSGSISTPIMLRNPLVTAARCQVGTVLCVQEQTVKQAWCLATSSTEAMARM
jgi:hypothetical protein